MAELQINATQFLALLRRLGVSLPPPEAFVLEQTVFPVALVDSDVTLSANVRPTVLPTISYATNLAPASGTVLADTGALPAGDYLFKAACSLDSFAASRLVHLEHRNAANSANIWRKFYIFQSGAPTLIVLDLALRMAQDERLRWVAGQAFGAGEDIDTIIFRTLLS